MMTNDTEIMSRSEVEQKLKDEATAVDIEALVRLGILEKKGAWYQIHKWNELPLYAKSGIVEVKTADESLGVKVDEAADEIMLVKFRVVKAKPRSKRTPPNPQFRIDR